MPNMDPLSIIGVEANLAGVVDVALRTTAALIKYAKDTKHASSDRKLLADETESLSKLLQRLRDRAQSTRNDEKWLDEHKNIVRQFEAAYDDLAMTLKYDAVTGKIRQESRYQTVRSIAKWSFTKSEIYSLLERVTRLQQNANMLLSDDQHTLLEQMDQKQQKQQEALDQKLKKPVLSWLSPLQMFQIHQAFSDRAEKGSGEWFLADPAFLKNERKKVAHGSGVREFVTGAGKTVLASIIVNHLRRNRPEDSKGRVGIVFTYLRYNEPEQTFENVVASMLKQLAEESDRISPALLGLYEHHRDRKTSPTIDNIFEALSATMQTYDQVFCIIDALDECTEDFRWDLIERLEKQGPKLRVLITSRYLDSIAEELASYDRCEIKANKADIELFVEQQIRRNRNLRKTVAKSPSLRSDIKHGVVKTAEDMFLLARLHVESLASAAALSVKHVRNKLDTLPTTLTGTYDDAMERIEKQNPDHKRIAFKATAWVSYAFRSLSLKELQHALAVEPGDTVLDEELVMDGQSITSLCAGLVVVDQRTNVVNLVHYSTKSYFEDIRHIHFPEFHATITLVCATYLTLDSLKGAKIWEMVQKYPLACYAAQYMGDHARNSPEEALEPSILDMICNLLSHPDKRRPLLSLLDGLDLIQAGFYSEGKPLTRENTEALLDSSIKTEIPPLFDSVLELAQHQHSDASSTTSSITITGSDTATESDDRNEDEEVWEAKIKSSRIPEVAALHLAASMGLAKIASLLLKETTNIDAVDETGKTALTLALERGFEKAVEFLVNSGASVDLRHEHGRGVLLLVTERGWFNAGDTIVEKARVTAEEETSESARDRIDLLLNAYEGNVNEVARLVSNNSISLQSDDRDIGAAALFVAGEKELINMVETLLAFGVDVNSKDDLGQTLLHRATHRKSEAMITLLLRHGADVDAKADDYRTPWSANLRNRNEKILQILLDAGANPSTYGQQGVTELYAAAKDGDSATVEYMLRSGTNPSVQTQYGWTTLHWAASYGHVDCVKLLLEAGAELDPCSDQRVTPLDLADQAEQTVTADMLLKAGAHHYADIVAPAWLPALEELEKDGQWLPIKSADKEENAFASLDEGKVGPDGGKLRLCYDKPLARTLKKATAVGQYVYPVGTHGKRDNIYEVSHILETSSHSINIRRSPTRPEMWDYSRHPRHFDIDDMLYEVTRMKPDYQEFELCGKQQNALLGTIRMHKDWTGGWKIRPNTEGNTKPYLLRTTPEWSKKKEEDSRWMIEDGVLQARSGWDDGTPWICFELGVGRQMQDVIVTCWITKLWSETAAGQRRESVSSAGRSSGERSRVTSFG